MKPSNFPARKAKRQGKGELEIAQARAVRTKKNLKNDKGEVIASAARMARKKKVAK